MERGQFTFYRSYYEALLTMPKKDRESLFMAICAFALDGKEPSLSGIQAGFFAAIRPTLANGRKKAEARLTKTAEASETDFDSPTGNNKEEDSSSQWEEQNDSLSYDDSSGENKNKRENKNKKENKNKYKCNPPTPLSGVEAAMVDFAEMRKKLRKPLTEAARALTLRELEKLAPGDEEMQVAILNQSIQRGWQGVFPLKDEKPAKGLPKEVKPLKGGDDLDRLERMLQ